MNVDNIKKQANIILQNISISDARKRIASEFKEDEDFFFGYVANVAECIEIHKNEETKKIAAKVLELIFGMNETEEEVICQQ